MDTPKKAVVESPKNVAPPVKAPPPPEHKHQQEAAKPAWNQPAKK